MVLEPAGSKSVINLLRGWPSAHLLPPKLLLNAASDTLNSADCYVPALQYAPDEGDARLRLQLARFLSSFYRPASGRIDDARITITGGASQSLAVLLSVATDPGYTRAVWAVEPTYFLACRIFDDAGLRVHGVPDGEGGVDVMALKERLQQAERKRKEELGDRDDRPMFKPITRSWPTRIYKHVIYAVPSFSNPTGRCMTLPCREDLVRVAREFDALIICDDVYDFLWWPITATSHKRSEDEEGASHFTAVLPRLVDVDRYVPGNTTFGNVVSNGSFSKICGPGARTGWIEANAPLAHAISQAGSSRSGGAASGLVASVLGAALSAGTLQAHITQHLRPAYARRWHTMRAAVREHLLPLGASLPFDRIEVRGLYGARADPLSLSLPSLSLPTPPPPPPSDLPSEVAGGYFIYVRLPRGVSAAGLAARAEAQAGVMVQTEGMCLVPKEAGKTGRKSEIGGEGHRHVRLCFAWEDEPVLVEGVKRLAEVLQAMLFDGDDGTSWESGDRSSSRYS